MLEGRGCMGGLGERESSATWGRNEYVDYSSENEKDNKTWQRTQSQYLHLSSTVAPLAAQTLSMGQEATGA